MSNIDKEEKFVRLDGDELHGVCCGLVRERASESPNDPKLSDGGAWRGSCEGGAQREATDVGQSHDRTRRVQARIAATVTRGAVRCSAWLGDVGFIVSVRGESPAKMFRTRASNRVDRCATQSL